MKIAPKPKPESTVSLDDLLREKPKTPIEALRGHPFVTDIQIYDNPADWNYGNSITHECRLCFYRNFPKNPDGDCYIEGDKAKLAFGIPLDRIMPTRLDGKEVGAFCPYFVDLTSE